MSKFNINNVIFAIKIFIRLHSNMIRKGRKGENEKLSKNIMVQY